jgi:hypothetical protein
MEMRFSHWSLRRKTIIDIVPDVRTDRGTDRIVVELVWCTIDRFARKQALHDTRLRTQRIPRETLADPDARQNIWQTAALHAEQL